MKKNRGFTLIELLATIIILAGIALIAFPTLLNAIKNSENKIDSATKKLVVSAASLYIDTNLDEYPKDEGNTYCIPFSKLIEDKYLEKGILDAADVDASNKTVKVTVTDSYDYSIVNSNNCTNIVRVCKYQGTDSSKKYEYGAEYECELGDGVYRTFYVLEDGDTTELAKGDGSLHYSTDKIGTTSEGEVSLIMDQNLDNYGYNSGLKWCSSVDSSDISVGKNLVSCNADGVRADLEELTTSKGWIVSATLPTYAQAYQASGNKNTDLPAWLWTNLYDGESAPTLSYGYWTSSASTGFDYMAGIITNSGTIEVYTITGSIFGVRPVITITKDML